jgi:hypothetical protein
MSTNLASEGPLDTAAVRGQFERFSRQRDDKALAALLTRYLTQPLSDSETAWAYKHLANAFACGEHPAEAVLAHEAFERWLPGKSPRLSVKAPFYYPAPEGSSDATVGADEIRVQFLAQSVQFATSYGAIGRYDEFVAKADAALAGLTPSNDNLSVRFFGVYIFMDASQLAGDFERAERRILEMHAIADQAADASKAAELRAFALTSEIQLARGRNDAQRVADKVQGALSLLGELERNALSGYDWVRGFRHNLAHHLIGLGRHELALPVLDPVLATGHHLHGYTRLMHAAAVWTVTGDRQRTLGLLRDARDGDVRDLAGDFQTTPGFGDVRDDPEFLQAISRES